MVLLVSAGVGGGIPAVSGADGALPPSPPKGAAGFGDGSPNPPAGAVFPSRNPQLFGGSVTDPGADGGTLVVKVDVVRRGRVPWVLLPKEVPFTALVDAGRSGTFERGGSGPWLWPLCRSGVFHGSSWYSIEGCFRALRWRAGEAGSGACGGVAGRWGGLAPNSSICGRGGAGLLTIPWSSGCGKSGVWTIRQSVVDHRLRSSLSEHAQMWAEARQFDSESR